VINRELPLGQRVLSLSQTISDDPLNQTDTLLHELEKQWRSRIIESDLLGAGIEKRRQALFHFFYQELGFDADQENYFLPAGSDISTALSSRSGGPMILGVLLLHLAKITNIELEGINYPSHFLLTYTKASNKPIYFDPYSQEILDKGKLGARLKGSVSQFTLLDPKVHLRVLTSNEIIQRFISVSKASYIRSHQHLFALRCNELLLEIEPNDPYEIRDRGFLFEQLDCHQLAIKDYKYFMRHCPDDPAVPLLKLQTEILKNSHNVLH